MADDLVQRLRTRADYHQAAIVRSDRAGYHTLATDHEARCSEYREAAARIEALEAALEHLAKRADYVRSLPHLLDEHYASRQP